MNKCKIVFYQTLMISTAILVGLGIQEIIDYFRYGIESFEIEWYIPITIPLTALLCSIPSILIIDCEGLSKKRIIFRVIVHFICLLMIVSGCGYLFKWYSNADEYIVILIEYVLIYAFVWLASWWFEKKDEVKINEALKDLQDNE